jgi:TonB family protein
VIARSLPLRALAFACCYVALLADAQTAVRASAPASGEWTCRRPDPPPVVYPREAVALGLTTGHVVVKFTIEAGEIVDVHAMESTHPVFTEAAMKIVRATNCRTEKGFALHAARVRVPFDFSLR